MTSGLIAYLAVVGIQPTAQADLILNLEPNDTFATAQVIPTAAFTLEFNPHIGTGGDSGFQNTSMTLPHVTILRPGDNQVTANFDFFRFTTFERGIIVADIDSKPLATNFDTVLLLFNGQGVLLATNDDEVVDEEQATVLIECCRGSDGEEHSQDRKESAPQNCRSRQTLPMRPVPQKKPETCQEPRSLVLP
jgi:hypothetical protein